MKDETGSLRSCAHEESHGRRQLGITRALSADRSDITTSFFLTLGPTRTDLGLQTWNCPEFGELEKRNLVESQQEVSMSNIQPTYTKEFKQHAVQLFQTSGKSKTQSARGLGI